MSGAGVTFISSPGGEPSAIAPAKGEAMGYARLHDLFDGCGDQSAEVEQVVLERLLLSSLARDEADQP